MACWCATNEKEKAKAIDDTQVFIEDNGRQIQDLLVTSMQLQEEIDSLHKERELSARIKVEAGMAQIREHKQEEWEMSAKGKEIARDDAQTAARTKELAPVQEKLAAAKQD